MSEGPKKAGVLGSPIAHSRSPQLHLAAYRALGLHDWTYERIECGAAELPVVVGGFGPEWVGVSVTMPGKFAALRFADERTARADLVGSANTLVRTPHGWRADNTDIDGVAGALGAAAGHALVLGSGGPHRRPWWGWPNSGSPTSPWWRATRTRRPGWWTWAHGSAWRPGSARSTAVGWPMRWPPRKCWSAPFQRRWPRVCRHLGRDPGAVGRHLRSVAHTAGRRGRIGGRAGDQRAADVAASGVRAGGAVHRATCPREAMTCALAALD